VLARQRFGSRVGQPQFFWRMLESDAYFAQCTVPLANALHRRVTTTCAFTAGPIGARLGAPPRFWRFPPAR
jgi:hypothetical protein